MMKEKSMKITQNIVSVALAIAATLSLTGCVNELGSVGDSSAPMEENKAFVEGEVIIKFAPEVEHLLQRRTTPTRTTIAEVDAILDEVGAYDLERVFPVDLSREDVTRKSGMHLWYVVRFKGEDEEAVATRLSSLGEIQRVDLNRTVRRAYNGKAVPMKTLSLSRAGGSVAAMNDPMLGEQWNLINTGANLSSKCIEGADVGAEGAWQLSTGCEDVIVAVLDEGVCVEHPDLKANIWVNEDEIAYSREDNDSNGYKGDINGYNFVKNSGIITWNNYLDSGHGSHVAGVIAAVNNNGEGISSIAGGNGTKGGVKIMSCQIFSGNVGTSVLEVARAMKYAADNGAVILQCSWGYVSGEANGYDWGEQGFHSEEEWKMGSPLEYEALDYFVHNAGSANGPITGGVVVFAGGNESAPAAGYPGAADFAVSVAATAADFTPAVYTNYGPGTTISAPGGDQDYYWDFVDDEHNYGEVGCILSTLPFNVSESGYGWMEGTSMACPHISGVLALAISHAAERAMSITPDQLKEALYSTARNIDDYMVGEKFYKRYVADIGPLQPMKMDLSLYKGQMGAGQVDAAALLAEIEGVGVPMRFPNIYVGQGEKFAIKPAKYFVDGADKTYSVTIQDGTIATCVMEGDKLIFEGVKSGMTSAVLVADGEQHTFTITVRKGAGSNGWM